MVYNLICEVQKYLETREGESRDTNLCRIYIRRIEHLYYKVSWSRYYHIQQRNIQLLSLSYHEDLGFPESILHPKAN